MVKTEQDAIEEIKKSAAHDNLLDYSYFNEEFITHTNAIYFQLEDVISQNGKPITYFSRKINI